jgi:hypothetical protein
LDTATRSEFVDYLRAWRQYRIEFTVLSLVLFTDATLGAGAPLSRASTVGETFGGSVEWRLGRWWAHPDGASRLTAKPGNKTERAGFWRHAPEKGQKQASKP